jgi:hypothetical protein
LFVVKIAEQALTIDCPKALNLEQFGRYDPVPGAEEHGGPRFRK